MQNTKQKNENTNQIKSNQKLVIQKITFLLINKNVKIY